MPTKSAPAPETEVDEVDQLELLDHRGTPRPLSIVETGIPALDELGAAYSTAFAEFRAARDEARRLQGRNVVDRAKASDAAAFAAARRAGDDDPGPRHLRALIVETEDAGRIRDGSRTLAAQLGREYVDAVAEHRPQLERLARERVEETRAAASKHVRDLVTALVEVAGAAEFSAWISEGPRRPSRSSAPRFVIDGGRPRRAEEVAELLRELVDRPTRLEEADRHAEPVGFVAEPGADKLRNPDVPRRGSRRSASNAAVLDDGKGSASDVEE